MATDHGYTLAHPVYLDVPMMVSFLAALEGGVSFSGSETSTETGARERMLGGKSGIRARLFGVAEAELGAEGSTSNRDETSFVSATERHHTSASLFNILYGYLKEDDQIRSISSPNDLTEIQPGQLVELSAKYLGNPIEDILAFFGAVMPYIQDDEPEPDASPAANKRSGNPAQKATAAKPAVQPSADDNDGIKILKMMAQDLVTAPVHDLLFQTSDGLEAVVTVASEYYSASTNENLRAGEFRVVGKVTRVLAEGEEINLTRRTVMGVASPEMTRGIIDEVTSGEALSLTVANPIVAGPALQLLPMSIFV